MSTMEREYVAQIQAMASRAERWRRENPNREALVQFNYPAGIMVAAPISIAIDLHFVTVNDAGLELIKALGHWGDAKEPTVFMVRLAIEHG